MPSLKKIGNPCKTVVKGSFFLIYKDAHIVKHCRSQGKMDATNSMSIQSQVYAREQAAKWSHGYGSDNNRKKKSWK